ncbi:Pre-mRNA splicing factor [Mycena indigotica]|uniref:Pre-mRNA splicing factor n=1 Tax=Mycena indigotica TaxID=2126181 RepID=A0A8H6T728_9AGAR|nr:Pre-mRNA splicing factor [Mycena indigotica]KAF7312105.1 Pre-mRNA splicing factor [Mycena indigotica]
MSIADDDEEQARRLVYNVYNNIQSNFLAWKADYAARAMASASLSPLLNNTDINTNVSTQLTLYDALSIALVQTNQESLEYHDLESGTVHNVRMDMTRVCDPRGSEIFVPSPVYEHCAPIDRNNHHGDDSSKVPFIPFEDDPGFDLERYFVEFSGLAWTQPQMDPDLESVVVETARRLHYDHGMDLHRIASADVLPLPLFNQHRSQGMIHSSRRRDFFSEWPVGVSAAEKILPSQTPLAQSIKEAVQKLTTEFCTNLNCVIGFCSTHLDPLPEPLPGPPATLRNERLHEMVKEPCSVECFLLVEEDEEDFPDLFGYSAL